VSDEIRLIPGRALGCNRSSTRDLMRALWLPRYMKALPPPPAACDNTRGFSQWGMMLNDQLGCCVVAGKGHAIQAWTESEYGRAVTVPDAEIRGVYLKLSPRDAGLDIGTFLKWMQANGLKDGAATAHKVGAYGGVDPSVPDQIKQAVFLFGVVSIGIDLPSSWYNNADQGFVWDKTNARIIGGHDVTIVGYNAQGVTIVTWGVTGTITWAGLAQHCGEAWAILAPDWYAKDGISPSGLDVANLAYDLAVVTSQPLPPLPPLPPVPPVPPDPDPDPGPGPGPGPAPLPPPPSPSPPPSPFDPCPSVATITRAFSHVRDGVVRAMQEIGRRR